MSDTYKVLLLYIRVLKYRTYDTYVYLILHVLWIHIHRNRTYSWENTQAPVKKNRKKFVNVRMCHALTLNASFDKEHGFRCIENGPHAKD